jgi:hypothetical protein
MTDQLKPILSVQACRRPLYIPPSGGHLVKDWVNLGGPKSMGNPIEYPRGLPAPVTPWQLDYKRLLNLDGGLPRPPHNDHIHLFELLMT